MFDLGVIINMAGYLVVCKVFNIWTSYYEVLVGSLAIYILAESKQSSLINLCLHSYYLFTSTVFKKIDWIGSYK